MSEGTTREIKEEVGKETTRKGEETRREEDVGDSELVHV